jgi:hypothetical protein
VQATAKRLQVTPYSRRGGVQVEGPTQRRKGAKAAKVVR